MGVAIVFSVNIKILFAIANLLSSVIPNLNTMDISMNAMAMSARSLATKEELPIISEAARVIAGGFFIHAL